MFAALGLEELPNGASQLTHKQLMWCVEFLRCGSATEAARLAGYSSPDSDGYKVQKSAVVARFLAQVVAPLAKDADQLVARVAHRSRAYQALWQAEHDKPAGLRNTKELERLGKQARAEDTTLAALLGKIQSVHVTGDLKHSIEGSVNHTTSPTIIVPPEALNRQAEMRRDVVMTQRQGGPN